MLLPLRSREEFLQGFHLLVVVFVFVFYPTVADFLQTLSCKRVDLIKGSTLEADWKKSPLPHQGLEPTSLLHLAFRSAALPTELSLRCSGLD